MKKIGIIFGTIFCIFAAYAETFTMTWLNEDITTTYDTTTCEAGDDITLPTAPTKRGYTFMGWTRNLCSVIADFNENGTTRYAKTKDSNNREHCFYQGEDSGVSCSNAMFSDLEYYYGKVDFNYGTIYVQGLCSSTSGTLGQIGTPNEENGSGQYCWCRAYKVKLFDDDTMCFSIIWVAGRDRDNTNRCLTNCAADCAYDVYYNTNNFRETLLLL